jgi:plastocyanin
MHFTRFVGISGVALMLACSSSTGSNLTAPSGGGGGGGGGGAGGTSADITIQDYSFSPATLTVKVGTTVRWTNNGPSAHTTVSDNGVWTSGRLGAPGGGGGYGGGGSAGGTFGFTFMTPGTFGYHCAIHPPSMFPGFVGSVVVTP